MKRSHVFIVSRPCFLLFIFILFYVDLFGQPEVKKELPQFLFSDFMTADIKMKTGPDITLDLNYNTVSSRMVFKMGGNLYDMVNPESVDTIYMQQSVFVPYDSVFLEVVSTGKIVFFIQHNSFISIRSKPEMKGTAQASSSNYYSEGNSSTVYFNQKLPSGYTVKQSNILRIRVNGTMSEFKNERQLLKIFPDYTDQIKTFIKESHLKVDNKPDLIRIGVYCNDLMKQYSN